MVGRHLCENIWTFEGNSHVKNNNESDHHFDLLMIFHYLTSLLSRFIFLYSWKLFRGLKEAIISVKIVKKKTFKNSSE